jgi:hypothetical protein
VIITLTVVVVDTTHTYRVAAKTLSKSLLSEGCSIHVSSDIMHHVFWQETIGVAAKDVIVVDRHQCFSNSVTLSVCVEIRLSNLSMSLPMLISMSASMTAFLTASFIFFLGILYNNL